MWQEKGPRSALAGLIVPLLALSAPRHVVAQTTAPSAPAPARATKSTPEAPSIRQALDEAYKRFKGLKEGKNADYIPVLAKVNAALYGLAVVSLDGTVTEAGDASQQFSIQSVAKVFVLARAIEDVGAEAVEKRIGVDSTGLPFNSVLAIGLNKTTKRPPAGNPLVNAGAMSTVDMLSASGADAKWKEIIDTLSAFAGRPLAVNEEVYKSETDTNTHNRGIANLMKDYGVIKGDPAQALDLYTRECSVNVNARDLAVMGATLANGGRNPITGIQVVSPDTAQKVLGVMATAGLYENSGTWLFRVGAPAKSGVGGGIVAVVPGRFAVAGFSPPLDSAGNSVRAQKAIEAVITQLNANPFHASPAARRPEQTPNVH